MARISSFRELDVWQLSMELVIECYALTSDISTFQEKLTRVGQMLHGLQRSLETSHRREARWLSVFAALLTIFLLA